MPAESPSDVTRVLVKPAPKGDAAAASVFVARVRGRTLAIARVVARVDGTRPVRGARPRETPCADPLDALLAMDRACEKKRAAGYGEYRYDVADGASFRLLDANDGRIGDPSWPAARGVLDASLLDELAATERGRANVQDREEAFRRLVGPGATWSAQARAVLAAYEGHLPISRLEPWLLPAVRLDARPVERVLLGASRLGGEPDMPADLAWPARETESGPRPLSFLGQIALEDLPGDVGLLPRSGSLLFFYDVRNKPWGHRERDRGSARVLYVEAGRELAHRASPPALGDGYIAELQAVTMIAGGSLPCGLRPEVTEEHLDERSAVADHPIARAFLAQVRRRLAEVRTVTGSIPPASMETYNDLVTKLTNFESRLLGWPDLAQVDDPRPSKSWTLLLELVDGDLSPRDRATEDAAERWAWGDAGFLCLWIEEEALKAGRFDDVRATIQSS